MVNYEPDYCPYCGTALTTTETPRGDVVLFCPAEERPVFHNPVPLVGVAVVDGDRLLLVEQDFRDGWMVPGGHVEVGEGPEEAAARELEEETSLAVDPGDLAYALAHAVEPVEGKHAVYVEYAVSRAATTGTLDARSDATDAAFLTPAEFRDSEHTLQASQAQTLDGDLDRRLAAAREAVGTAP